MKSKGDNPMKTKEELNALKKEVETVNKKLHDLTDEELDQVSGGFWVNPLIGVDLDKWGEDYRKMNNISS